MKENLRDLYERLRSGEYQAPPVRRAYIEKDDGRKRPLGIPTVRDRVAQAATKVVLEPIFEADFRDWSYGFRPRRSAHQAMGVIRSAVNTGANWVVDAVKYTGSETGVSMGRFPSGDPQVRSLATSTL